MVIPSAKSLHFLRGRLLQVLSGPVVLCTVKGHFSLPSNASGSTKDVRPQRGRQCPSIGERAAVTEREVFCVVQAGRHVRERGAGADGATAARCCSRLPLHPSCRPVAGALPLRRRPSGDARGTIAAYGVEYRRALA